MRCISDNPRRVKISEVLKVWKIRHKNTQITKHEIYGLPFLITALEELPPESVLDQIGIVGDELAGVFWCRIDNGKLVGAVISSIGQVDGRW
jgi:hypothetical protein